MTALCNVAVTRVVQETRDVRGLRETREVGRLRENCEVRVWRKNNDVPQACGAMASDGGDGL